MPFFMDVHRSTERISYREVAAAHLADVEAQSRFGVTYHQYFLNEEAGTVFCVAEAPDAGACEAVHEVAHGNTAEEIIEISPLMLEVFLGKPLVDADGLALHPDGRPDAAERTIVFTDIVDSTAWGVQLGDEAALAIITVHDRAVSLGLAGRAGRAVKRTGDGSMLAFEHASEAVDAAIEIQRRLVIERGMPGAPDLHVRIGLNLGEPVAAHDDLYGTAVNLARRVCDAAGPDEIYTTQTVVDRLDPDAHVSAPLGERTLKGFDHPVGVHRVTWTPPAVHDGDLATS
jgi:class 3 adenylate cyclase